MGGKHGIKETKEVLGLIKEIALSVIAESKKEGWSPRDVLAFLKSETVEIALAPAIEGADKVLSEVTELDLFEGIALSRYAYGVMDEIIDSLKA